MEGFIMIKGISYFLFLSFMLTIICPGQDTLTTKASDSMVTLYKEIFISSVLRGINLQKEIDPDEAIREEIFLEAKLSKMAQSTEIVKNPSLLADIDYYQTALLLNKWANHNFPLMPVEKNEIEEYYSKNKEEFKHPEKVSFRHIFFMVPQNSNEATSKEKKETAEKVYKLLLRGVDFEKLADEYSDQPSARQNKGVVGPVDINKLNPAVSNKLKMMKKDEISSPVQTPYGWEILQLLEQQPGGSISLGKAKDYITAKIQEQKVKPLQKKKLEEIENKYPATIDEKLLEKPTDDSKDKILVTIGEKNFSYNYVLNSINATHTLDTVKNETEKIRQGLPQFIQTEQIRLSAIEQGLLNNPDLKNQFQFWHNRLIAERYFKTYQTKRIPTDEELEKYYKENIETFSYPPEVKGKKFIWYIPEYELKKGSELAFVQESLKIKVNKLRQSFNEKKITLQDLEKEANEVIKFDWIQPGPSGYHADAAYFGTNIGELSHPFNVKGGVAIALIEDKKESKPQPFLESHDKVVNVLKNLWNKEEKKNLIDQILKEYALLP